MKEQLLREYISGLLISESKASDAFDSLIRILEIYSLKSFSFISYPTIKGTTSLKYFLVTDSFLSSGFILAALPTI